MVTVRQLSLFLASPQDCSAERAVVRQVVDEYNASFGKMHDIRVEVVGWDTHARPAAGKDGQALINQQIADMKQHALFVGLLWNRFGTPTPRAASGTKEEFDLAVKARGRRANESPEIMFYFNEAPSNLSTQKELDQKSQVLGFKTNLKKTLYWTFDGPRDFETLFRRHYGNWLSEIINTLPPKPESVLAQKDNVPKRPEETPLPTLALHNFYYYPEDVFGEPRTGPFYPKALRKAIATTIAFTIACSSSQPIRLQNVYIRVLEATPLRQATFPAYERGGNGITPVLGWTELEPNPNPYQIMTNVKWNVGKGLDPADFHIRAFCRAGSEFKICVEVEWMDLSDQKQTHRYTFADELMVAMPELVQWKKVVTQAKKLRILVSSQDALFLLEDLQSMKVEADTTILAPMSEDPDQTDFAPREPDELRNMWNQSVVLTPESETRRLTDLVGTYGTSIEEGATRNFIIADNDLMMIENADRDELAEIVEDGSHINKVIDAFDDLVRRFSAPK